MVAYTYPHPLFLIPFQRSDKRSDGVTANTIATQDLIYLFLLSFRFYHYLVSLSFFLGYVVVSLGHRSEIGPETH